MNSSGAIGTSYTYQPFGATTTGGSANGNSYEFTGRENDATGLYFYRARYYSSTYQRFVSQDPSDFAGGDTNLYSYVGDSPIDLIDPAGLYWDLNFTFGWLMPFFPYFPALTTGLQFDQCGVHPYIGGGEASPGPSVSLTYSPGNASLGGGEGVQAAGGGLVSQQGYAVHGGYFSEVGIGTPGLSATAYDVFSGASWSQLGLSSLQGANCGCH